MSAGAAWRKLTPLRVPALAGQGGAEAEQDAQHEFGRLTRTGRCGPSSSRIAVDLRFRPGPAQRATTSCQLRSVSADGAHAGGPTRPGTVVESTDWQRVERFGRALCSGSRCKRGLDPGTLNTSLPRVRNLDPSQRTEAHVSLLSVSSGRSDEDARCETSIDRSVQISSALVLSIALPTPRRVPSSPIAVLGRVALADGARVALTVATRDLRSLFRGWADCRQANSGLLTRKSR
jgi:hypothetical protein